MMKALNPARRRLLHMPTVGLLALLVTSGCAPNPAAPTSVTGTWVGTVSSNLLGTFASQLTLTQSGSSISGFFTSTIPGQTTSGSGALTGSVQGSNITLQLPTGTCIRAWTGTLSGTTMSGSFVATGTCGNPDSGTFSLTLE
jgi:hypothetical protein